MKSNVTHGSADQMLDAFRDKLDELGDNTVESATDIEPEENGDERYIHSLIGDVDSAISDRECFDSWNWETQDDVILLTTVKDSKVNEFEIPVSDLSMNFDTINKDVDYIMGAIDEEVEASTKVQASGLWDFGAEEAEKYGDMIVEALAGKTVSKRRDTANEPGGLIYEADALGIDKFELLRALEGMCREGRCREIDDSTYKVFGCKSTEDITASEELEEITPEGFYQHFSPTVSSDVMNNAARILYEYCSSEGYEYVPEYVDIIDIANELDDEDERHIVLMALGEEDEDEEYWMDDEEDVESCDKVMGSEDPEYRDSDGVFGLPGDNVKLSELKAYWDEQYDEDPSLQEYDSYEDWLEDTLEWLTPVTSDEEIIDDVEYDSSDNFEILRTKQVEDSDGFMTDYTMYQNTTTGEYVCVFGDRDVYQPEDGYFDFETDSEDEANEWFDSYKGFAEDEDVEISDI